MKEHGFTLVEVISIIVILGIITIITVPLVEGAIKKGRNNLYNSQIKTIELAAKDWASDNALYLPKNDGEQITLTILQLKGAGKLEFNLIDPISEKMFDENMEITITRDNKNYVYEVIDKDGSGNTFITDETEFNPDTPMIKLNGSNIVYINQGDEYNDLGCTATDYDGNYLSCSLTSGTVSIYTPGSYYLTYSATNHGITSRVKRTVVVLPI